jgi:hypothetical protein
MSREYKTEEVNGQTIIWYEEDGFIRSFPTDPANSDYQAYLASLNDTPQG